MDKFDIGLHETYKSILAEYLVTNSEHSLYKAGKFSRELIKNNMSPEDMINLHVSVVQTLIKNLPKEVSDTNDLLLEVMVGYGLAYLEHQSLRDRQKQINSEFAVAAKMQKQLLPIEIPDPITLDVGIKAVAAGPVSGDYYHLQEDENGYLSIAVADIIGKGIPAALCMSMIKYGLDSLPEQRLRPGALLENLNRVIEQNISTNMFITMIYGSYDLQNHIFHYAGAGHEPGFYYQSGTNNFQDLTTKGLVLGLKRTARFQEYELKIEAGDFLVLLSDGVTECRTEDGFITRAEVTTIIKKYLHLPAQKIVDNVYDELEKLQDFQLQDDFTLMIIRREV
ncbi:phosphoserine phosphatase [Anaerobacillus alkaliphilus]|uniref:Phosphoserine phosphatase n=1 Tax=Anaerobacillus alkaliphilus TaxID=1548597 RepID=A0A4Q0VWP0_9BACI|nr:PP2C family protein-serine/threonine phosphatase [Anaerobacillus alkaliphilus]RXJ01954.1 phosphoserine phosphatase [Anaerobacillus alkaliphilus]